VVNREVLASDLLIGIGGVYPQHSTGFGGGSKLLLGVLGRRSIVGLHYGHPSMDGAYETNNDFRRDLDEMARILGFRTLISLHVDAERRVVRLTCGDHFLYYPEAASFSRTTYRAPLPGKADVVIANTYPIDVSVTFMRSKGVIPLLHAAPGASRILIASCSEGLGHHGLFPLDSGSTRQRTRHLARRVMVGDKRALARRLRLRVTHKVQGLLRSVASSIQPPTVSPRHPIWLHVGSEAQRALPPRVAGLQLASSWLEIVERVEAEQAARKQLDVMVYPCAPLQVLESASSGHRAVIPSSLGVLD
jgi:hypothetical protein